MKEETVGYLRKVFQTRKEQVLGLSGRTGERMWGGQVIQALQATVGNFVFQGNDVGWF